jgi:hypothetical protein
MIGGAGTGAGWPPLDPVLPLDDPDDEPLLDDEDEVEEEPLELPDDEPPLLEDVLAPPVLELLLEPLEDQPPDELHPPPLDDQPELLDP